MGGDEGWDWLRRYVAGDRECVLSAQAYDGRKFVAPPAPDADALRAEVAETIARLKAELAAERRANRKNAADAEAAEARAATAEAEVERLREALNKLEGANEKLCGLRSDSAYLCMIRRARSALSPAQARNADQSRQEVG